MNRNSFKLINHSSSSSIGGLASKLDVPKRPSPVKSSPDSKAKSESCSGDVNSQLIVNDTEYQFENFTRHPGKPNSSHENFYELPYVDLSIQNEIFAKLEYSMDTKAAIERAKEIAINKFKTFTAKKNDLVKMKARLENYYMEEEEGTEDTSGKDERDEYVSTSETEFNPAPTGNHYNYDDVYLHSHQYHGHPHVTPGKSFHQSEMSSSQLI